MLLELESFCRSLCLIDSYLGHTLSYDKLLHSSMDIVAEDFTTFDMLLNVELEDVVTDVGLTEEVNLNVVDKPKDMVICLLHLALFFFQMLFDFIVEQGKLIQKFLAILVVHKVVD